MAHDVPHTSNEVTTFGLGEVPDGTLPRSVIAEAAEAGGRPALRIQLTQAVAGQGVPDVDYVDMPTFAILPVDFAAGTIEVDILSRLTPEAPDYARGFAGIAFHITDGGEQFEAVYLRPLNGSKGSPPAPRNARAIQYFSFPDWKYQRLRDEYPDGRYEAGADIGPDEWNRLRVEVTPPRVKAAVNGATVLDIEAKSTRNMGAIGLWVDIGTEAYFCNLVITSR